MYSFALPPELADACTDALTALTAAHGYRWRDGHANPVTDTIASAIVKLPAMPDTP